MRHSRNTQMRGIFSFFILSYLLLPAAVSFAATFNVTTAAELQAALTTAEGNGQADTINIAAGTYSVAAAPFTYSAVNTENFSLTIKGAGAGVTMLDGGGATRVLLLNIIAVLSDANADITITDLTIQNGNQINGLGGGLWVLTNPTRSAADVTIENCAFSGNAVRTTSGNVSGGGVNVTAGSGNIKLINNVLTNNTAFATTGSATGGGVVVSTSTAGGNITLTDNTFDGNSAQGNGAQAGGASVAAFSGDVTLTDNTFINNSVTNPAPFNFAGAGGADISGRTVILANNTFDGNSVTSTSGSGAEGGGARVSASRTVTLTSNIFNGNSVTCSSEGTAQGGGVSISDGFGSDSATFLVNNVVSNNSGTSDLGSAFGGGVFASVFALTFIHNTFTLNSISGPGSGGIFSFDGVGGGLFALIASDDSTVNIYNNIVRSNTATGDGDDISLFDDLDLNNIGSTINLFNNNFSDFFSFCDADDVDPCTPDIAQGSNIDVDPLFADAPNGDIHLQTGSPAINTGTAAAPSLPTTDFEGDQRIFGSAPDIGADESTTVVAVCGDDIVDSGEDCDDGNTENGDCCSATCDFESADTVCRAASGACDVAEMCTGTSADCPADGFASATTECRPATGVCDIADTCTGTSAECPAADLKSVAECRPTGGACDVAESCDGVGNECPADNFVAAGTECRASAGACDIAETCSGTAATCPADGFASVGTACGDVGTECTNQDSCNGSGSCTDQGFKASGTACGDAGNTDCNNPDTCNGAGNCQDNFEPGGTACTSDGSQCTQDLCNDMGSCTHPAAPVVCGNGCVEAGEECDDGNTDPGDGCSDMCQTETPPEAHDLATLGIKAPGTITLTAAKPTQTRTVTVSIQNRSPHPETIEPALVSLTVLSLGSCPNPTPVLGAGQLPVTLAPKQKVDVAFDVAFDCANDPLKSSKKDPDHKDYSYTATVNHAALGGALDSHPADDTCPRDALGLDPNPDGTITDKGCPEAKTTVTDVVMK